MLKWIVLAVAGYILYRMFSNDIKRKIKQNNDPAEKERKVAAGEMVKDPECGAYVAADSLITVRDGDIIHRFCSYDCRDKYLKRLENGGRDIPSRHEADE